MSMENTQFKKGKSGNPAGMKKGFKQKYKMKTVLEVFEETGFNPLENLVRLALDGVKEDTRLKATSELCRYFAPQLKSSEVKVTVTNHEEALDELK